MLVTKIIDIVWT